MVGDFLIESRCRRGHTSSATLRGFVREQVEHIAREIHDRCMHPADSDQESDTCQERVATVVSALSIREPRPVTVPPRTDTKPSMRAVRAQAPVILVQDEDSEGETSTNRPPPTAARDSTG